MAEAEARGGREGFSAAGKELNRIRQIIMVNLPLGLIVVTVGASGRYRG